MAAVVIMAVGMFVACKTQQTMCEKVSSPEQLPWLKQLVEKGTDYSGEYKLVKINKVDGQPLVNYGGFVGCQGECSLMVLSSITIYTAK